MPIKVHPLSKSPTLAWEEIAPTQNIVRLYPPYVSDVKPKNTLRVVCMSDTHSRTNSIRFNIPKGDIFIHAGDFTRRGRTNEICNFNKWLGRLPHKHKIVIAGNHELSLDKKFVDKNKTTPPAQQSGFIGCHTSSETYKTKDVEVPNRRLLTNCTYLQDEFAVIEGLKIYGSPWQPKHSDLAFNLPRGEKCLEKWDQIPKDIDILITHGPPVGYGDLNKRGERAGCVELLSTIQKRVQPKYHVYGHIHEETLPHKHKVVVAGCHELTFDESMFTKEKQITYSNNVKKFLTRVQKHGKDKYLGIKEKLTNCVYLENQCANVGGLQIFGAPWSPEFRGWAFNLPRGEESLKVWSAIPSEVDILVTHGPPLGRGDLTWNGERAGCVELLNTVQKRVKPKFHVYGHVHEDYGVTTDETTVFINASTCDLSYNPINPPIVFDILIPEQKEVKKEMKKFGKKSLALNLQPSRSTLNQ